MSTVRQRDALYELARHAGHVAGRTDTETAVWLRGQVIDPQVPAQVSGWLDGLAETRAESLEWPLPRLAADRAGMVVAL